MTFSKSHSPEVRKRGLKRSSPEFTVEALFLHPCAGVGFCSFLHPPNDKKKMLQECRRVNQKKDECTRAKIRTVVCPRTLLFHFFQCCSELLFLSTPPKVSNRCESSTELQVTALLYESLTGMESKTQGFTVVMPKYESNMVGDVEHGRNQT